MILAIYKNALHNECVLAALGVLLIKFVYMCSIRVMSKILTVLPVRTLGIKGYKLKSDELLKL